MSEVADPLFETLFRGSRSSVAIASAAPVQTIGTHSRAGNAMGRTRGALLTGAFRTVLANGTKITMSQVALHSGVAKATLYNHFRTRDAVLAALLAHEVDQLIERVSSMPLERALVQAASDIANHPLLRMLGQSEPGTVAALARVDARIETWGRVQQAIAATLTREGLGGASVVMRWLASYLVTPASPESILEDAQIVHGRPAGSHQRRGCGRSLRLGGVSPASPLDSLFGPTPAANAANAASAAASAMLAGSSQPRSA